MNTREGGGPGGIDEPDDPNQPYTEITYHRRSVYSVARRYRNLVCGRALHVGGGADFWLMRGAQQPLGLELLSGPAIDIVADVQALPFRDATFDAIVALEVLEHVPKPGTMADEMRRVLKPGGHVLLSTPFVWKMHRTPKDYWRFTRDSLEMIFRAYSSVQVHAVNGARETLMHVLYQYVEVFLDVLKLPKRLIYALKPVERIVYAAIPRERTNDPLWTTGWFVVARK